MGALWATLELGHRVRIVGGSGYGRLSGRLKVPFDERCAVRYRYARSGLAFVVLGAVPLSLGCRAEIGVKSSRPSRRMERVSAQPSSVKPRAKAVSASYPIPVELLDEAVPEPNPCRPKADGAGSPIPNRATAPARPGQVVPRGERAVPRTYQVAVASPVKVASSSGQISSS